MLPFKTVDFQKVHLIRNPTVYCKLNVISENQCFGIARITKVEKMPVFLQKTVAKCETTVK